MTTSYVKVDNLEQILSRCEDRIGAILRKRDELLDEFITNEVEYHNRLRFFGLVRFKQISYEDVSTDCEDYSFLDDRLYLLMRALNYGGDHLERLELIKQMCEKAEEEDRELFLSLEDHKIVYKEIKNEN